MKVLKESNSERIVAVPLSTDNNALIKYQIQRRLSSGTAFETISEIVVHSKAATAGQNMLTLSDLKIITSDAEQRCN